MGTGVQRTLWDQSPTFGSSTTSTANATVRGFYDPRSENPPLGCLSETRTAKSGPVALGSSYAVCAASYARAHCSRPRGRLGHIRRCGIRCSRSARAVATDRASGDGEARLAVHARPDRSTHVPAGLQRDEHKCDRAGDVRGGRTSAAVPRDQPWRACHGPADAFIPPNRHSHTDDGTRNASRDSPRQLCARSRVAVALLAMASARLFGTTPRTMKIGPSGCTR